MTGRSEDEARAKAARKFNVDQAKIDLQQGACVFMNFCFCFWPFFAGLAYELGVLSHRSSMYARPSIRVVL